MRNIIKKEKKRDKVRKRLTGTFQFVRVDISENTTAINFYFEFNFTHKF